MNLNVFYTNFSQLSPLWNQKKIGFCTHEELPGCESIGRMVLPKMTFEEGLTATVKWNLSHSEWIERIRSGEYRNWVEANYGER